MSETFNARLRRLREAQKMSAAEMARSIGVAPTTYREWEYGRGAKFPPFAKLSQALAISVTELVTGDEIEVAKELEELEQIEFKLRQIRLKLLATT